MSNRIIELRQQRAQLISEARQILERASAEKRELTDEESANWDAAMADEVRLQEKIDREQRQAAADATIEKMAEQAVREDRRSDDRSLTFASRSLRDAAAEITRNPEWRSLMATTKPEYLDAFRDAIWRGERRALQVDLDTAGGYLVTPLQMVDQLIKAIDDQVYIRQFATTFAVPSADSLGVPTLENDPADADWTTELLTGSADSTMSFGRRELHPHPVAKRLLISRTLLRKVAGAEALAISRLAYKFAITQEKAFMTGSGSGQPLGVFTASSQGISTSRDVSTGNSTTAIAFNNLIECKYTLKAAYWPRASWLFHRDAVKQIAKLVDGEGQYLWYPSVREGEPDRLLGQPFNASEYAPNTFTAGLYVGILGDFSHYWIADSLAFEMQRLVELYAATNQVGLIGRMESDGMPVLEEAFVRVTLASG